jgi:hypothetical protein
MDQHLDCTCVASRNAAAKIGLKVRLGAALINISGYRQPSTVKALY